MEGPTADLHGGQHGKEAVPGAAEGRWPSHIQRQANGCKKQEAPWRTVLHASPHHLILTARHANASRHYIETPLTGG